jgi:hypothetical protein
MPGSQTSRLAIQSVPYNLLYYRRSLMSDQKHYAENQNAILQAVHGAVFPFEFVH